MATKAFVLIETAVGKTRDVVAALKGIKGIKSADAVTGPYDIIVVIEGTDLHEVGDLVTGKVHAVSGVVKTISCLAVALP